MKNPPLYCLFRVVTVFWVVVYAGASGVATMTGHSALGVGLLGLALTWAPLPWLRGVWEHDGWVRGYAAGSAGSNERASESMDSQRSFSRQMFQDQQFQDQHCATSVHHQPHVIYQGTPVRAFWCMGDCNAESDVHPISKGNL